MLCRCLISKAAIKKHVKPKKVDGKRRLRRYLQCDPQDPDLVGQITKCSPKIGDTSVMKWSYPRDAVNGSISEGSGCYYCHRAHSVDGKFFKFTPKQLQTLVNTHSDQGKAA